MVDYTYSIISHLRIVKLIIHKCEIIVLLNKNAAPQLAELHKR